MLLVAAKDRIAAEPLQPETGPRARQAEDGEDLVFKEDRKNAVFRNGTRGKQARRVPIRLKGLSASYLTASFAMTPDSVSLRGLLSFPRCNAATGS